MFKETTKVGDVAELTVTRKPPEQIDDAAIEELRRRRAQVPSTWYAIAGNPDEVFEGWWEGLVSGVWVKLVFEETAKRTSFKLSSDVITIASTCDPWAIMGKVASTDSDAIVLVPDTVLYDCGIPKGTEVEVVPMSWYTQTLDRVIQAFTDDEQLAKTIRGLREQETNK